MATLEPLLLPTMRAAIFRDIGAIGVIAGVGAAGAVGKRHCVETRRRVARTVANVHRMEGAVLLRQYIAVVRRNRIQVAISERARCWKRARPLLSVLQSPLIAAMEEERRVRAVVLCSNPIPHAVFGHMDQRRLRRWIRYIRCIRYIRYIHCIRYIR